MITDDDGVTYCVCTWAERCGCGRPDDAEALDAHALSLTLSERP